MTMRTRIWGLTAAALALTLAGQAAGLGDRLQAHGEADGHDHSHAAEALPPEEAGVVTFSAVWKFHPKDFDEARDKARDVVLAEVVSVREGDDLVAHVPGLPNDEDHVPTQRVTVRVAK